MIYRKWSLLSATGILTTGIIGAVVVGHLLFVEDPYLKPKKMKPEMQGSTK